MRKSPDGNCHDFFPHPILVPMAWHGGMSLGRRHPGRGSSEELMTMTAADPPAASPMVPLEAMLARLLHANVQDITEVVAPLPEPERAQLAVFCYSRGHLHEIGLAVGATCDLRALINAAAAAGTALFQRSRAEPARESARAAGGGRSRITLAKSASGSSAIATIIASIANDEFAEAQSA